MMITKDRHQYDNLESNNNSVNFLFKCWNWIMIDESLLKLTQKHISMINMRIPLCLHVF